MSNQIEWKDFLIDYILEHTNLKSERKDVLIHFWMLFDPMPAYRLIEGAVEEWVDKNHPKQKAIDSLNF